MSVVTDTINESPTHSERSDAADFQSAVRYIVHRWKASHARRALNQEVHESDGGEDIQPEITRLSDGIEGDSSSEGGLSMSGALPNTQTDGATLIESPENTTDNCHSVLIGDPDLMSLPSLSFSLSTIEAIDPSLRYRIEMMGAIALGKLDTIPHNFQTGLNELASISMDGLELLEEFAEDPDSFIEQLMVMDSYNLTGSDLQNSFQDLDSHFVPVTEDWIEMETSDPGRRLFWRYNHTDDKVETMAEV